MLHHKGKKNTLTGWSMNLRAGHRHLEVLVTWLTLLLSIAEPHSCWPKLYECHNALLFYGRRHLGTLWKSVWAFPHTQRLAFDEGSCCDSFGYASLHDSSRGSIGHCSPGWWREQGVEAWSAKESGLASDCEWYEESQEKNVREDIIM